MKTVFWLLLFCGGAITLTWIDNSVPALPDGSPWADWAKPNVKWCEDNLSGWVTTPANTWSNLIYLVLGLLIWRRARRLQHRGILRLYGPAVMLTGTASLVYHGSYTAFFQYFDIAGVFLFCAMPFVLNLQRLRIIEPPQAVRWCLGIVLSCSLLMPPLHALGLPIQGVVLLLVVGIVGQEGFIWLKRPDGARYGYLLLSSALITIGGCLSLLDVTRTLCDPSDHVFQAHAAWHIASSLSILCLYYFHAQFADRPGLRR